MQLYAANMAEATQFIPFNNLDRIRDLLDRYRELPPGVADPRGPEWDYMARLTSRPDPIWSFQRQADVLAVALSPDGSQGVSADATGKILVWDPQSGTLRKEFQAHQGEARAAIFSPDGSHLATSGQDQRIRIWNAKTWEVERCRRWAHNHNIYALTY